MAAFGIHGLRRQAGEEFPDAHFSDTFGPTRDKFVSAVKGANIGERASKLRLPEVRRPERADSGPDAPARSEAPTQALPVDAEDARLQRLERLGSLRDKGILTDEEFAAEKSRLLGGASSD
ncbi:MAG: SHOCT domain-containing protein [Solirubrobacterales bacterium]|nr:SHOCT domain-containing protein [Solirubrobacterales bacterium]